MLFCVPFILLSSLLTSLYALKLITTGVNYYYRLNEATMGRNKSHSPGFPSKEALTASAQLSHVICTANSSCEQRHIDVSNYSYNNYSIWRSMHTFPTLKTRLIHNNTFNLRVHTSVTLKMSFFFNPPSPNKWKYQQNTRKGAWNQRTLTLDCLLESMLVTQFAARAITNEFSKKLPSFLAAEASLVDLQGAAIFGRSV